MGWLRSGCTRGKAVVDRVKEVLLEHGRGKHLRQEEGGPAVVEVVVVVVVVAAAAAAAVVVVVVADV